MSKSISGGVEIINTLSTKNDGDYPLVMAESVGMKDGANAEDVIKNKLNTNQGTENNGKFMKVGADGNLKPEIVPIPDVSAQINTHDKSPTSHNDIRDSVNTLKNDKLDKNQGVNNTGKIITVGDDGNVVTRFPNNVTYNPDTKNLEYGSNDSLPLIDGVKLDTSLTKGGFAADAKITGDKINKIESEATALKEDLAHKADAIIDSASGENITLADSDAEPFRGLRIFGRSTQDGTPTPESPVPIVSSGDKGTIEVGATGKNLLNLQCYSATTMTNLEEEPILTNIYGTEISTTEAVNKVVIKQKKIVNTETPSSYENGYMIFVFRDDFIIGKLYNLSFDLEVLNNPLNANEITLLVNGGYSQNVSIQKQIKTQFQYQKYGLRQYIELRCSGMDFILSNIMITEADYDYNYEPYHDLQTVILSTPNGLPGIKVDKDGNYTDKDGQQWVCDEINSTERIQRIGRIKSYNNEPINTKYMSSTGELSVGADVIYALGKSIVTPLTEDEKLNFVKLHTNYPTTVISNYENAGMEVEYIADTKHYIDKKFEELNQAIVNTQISLL